ncbi:GDSL-type esterase/lipase family protein [Enterococcus sp. DIV0240d]|uniref:GDSL-type esterase/lipase family protein n=1 Tax=Enterococcus sp. DIV0240d TaxID=2774717 RepID=UPI003F25CCD8
MNEDNKIFKTNEFSIEISPVGKAIQSKDIQYFSYDENSGLQLIHILMDGKPLDLPNGTEIRLSAVKLNNQNQKLIYTPEIVDPLKGIVSFVIPREFLGYRGKIRCGLYINFSNNQTMHVGYFYINMGVSDIDTNLTEFTEDFWQGWSEFEAGSTAKMQELEQRIDEQTEIFNNADVYNKAEIEDKLEPFALRTDIDTLDAVKADKKSLALTDSKVADLDSVKADKTQVATKADKTYVDSMLSSIAQGGPRELFYSLAALKAKYPSGADGTYLVFDSATTDGAHSYIWDKSVSIWKDLGIYQGVVIAEDSITTTKIKDKAVTIDKVDFFTPDFVNLVDTYIADEYYNITDGKILKKGETGYQANWGRTKLTAVNDGDIIYRNGKVGNSDTGPVFITFFADSSASQFVSGATWAITGQLSTYIVPVGAKYFSMSIRDTAKANGGEVSVNVSPGYKNTRQSLEIGNFSKITYTYDKGWLVSVPHSEDVLTIDYKKKEFKVKAIPCFATWGSNYKWIYGGGGISLPEQGFTYTFDEIQAAIGGVTERPYVYVFVRRDQGTVYSAKDMFSFYSAKYMEDRGGPNYKPFREQIIKSHVFIGMFVLTTTAYSFPGTPVSVVTTKAVDAITKKISFLGDSITTYAGYIPTGNVAFYPSSGAIKDVNLTWWKKLIDKSSGKLELLVNNSWSGSRVTTTGGTDSSGITRAELLDNQTDSPDIIIVYMGVNDFNNNVPIGTFDGSSALPNVTTTFGEAYGILLNKVVNKYPTAKVYCATIPINSRGPYPRTNTNGDTLASYNDRIRKIGESFGADILDFARAGFNHVSAANFTSDGLHPNESGMTIMYDKARKALGLY